MIPTAPFGRTGHESTRVIFGAAALGGMSQDRANTTLGAIQEWGINHIDTAAAYGASEDRLKPWLATHRSEVFLASKTGERGGPAARAELERSLDRLGTDHVDLIQLHNLVEEDEWAVAHGPGGAVEALVQARAEGLCRFIGVTGHGLRIPHMHSRSLERFDFDSVLFPYNHSLLADPGYRADVEALLERCADARGRRPDDQGHRPPPLARGRGRSPLQLVPADRGPRRHRPRRALRPRRRAGLPQHDERRPSAAADHRGRVGTPRPTDRRRAGGGRGGARHRPDLRRRHPRTHLTIGGRRDDCCHGADPERPQLLAPRSGRVR